MSVKILMLLICYVGGPGTASQAGPVVDKFMRQFERAAGWDKGAASGVYRARLSGCQAAMRASDPKRAPNVVVVDLPAYLSQHRAWGLKPLAHVGKAKRKRYYLLVRQASGYKDLASLKGKVLVSTLADEPKFLSRIIFDGKLDAATHFKLKKTRRPLKGIRKVARGRADATLVDELAFGHLKELSLPAKLSTIHRSSALPGLTLAAVARTSKELVAAIDKALPRLCAGAGKQLCSTFRIAAFTKARRALYRKLEKRYRGN